MAVKSGVSPERSTTGDMVSTGKGMISKSMAGKRTGPSNKNLGPSAAKKSNPASQVRALGGMNLKGPDKGAGGK
jgi:hypothetical protein